jgi:hypothetical protein
VWVLGKEFVYTSVETQVLDGTEGIHWVYFDSDGAIQVAVNPNETAEEDLIKRNALIAYIMLDDSNTSIIFADERHGLTMDGSTHFYLHEIQGFSYYEGLQAGEITADGSGASNASATLSITNGTLFDEDIKYETVDSGQTLTSPAQIPVYYIDGVAGSWRKDAADDFPVKNFVGGSGNLAYNSFSSPNYGQTVLSNNQYVLCHIFAVNDIDEPIIAIQGQAVYSTIGQARLGSEAELTNLNLLGAPAQEFTALYTIIFQSSDTYSNTPQARIRSTDLAEDYVDWRNVIISGGGITGSGDVVGPGTATDNAIVRFDGATGSVLQNSAVTIDDNGVIAGANLELTSPIINTILTATGKTAATFTEDGDSKIYKNEILTWETRADGMNIYATSGTVCRMMLYNASGNNRVQMGFEDDGNFIVKYGSSLLTGIWGIDGGGMRLYYANNGRMETIAGGISVTGEVTANQINGMNAPNANGEAVRTTTNITEANLLTLTGGTDSDALHKHSKLYYSGLLCLSADAGGISVVDTSGSDPVIKFFTDVPALVGSIQVLANDMIFKTSNETHIICNADTSVDLYFDNTKKFETAADGIIVAGNIRIQNPPADDTSSGITISADVDTNTVGLGGALLLGADGSWDDADATVEATAAGMLAIAVEAGTGTKVLLLQGMIQDAGTWDWTIGAILYLNTTVGEITETAPSGGSEIVRIIGYAMSADTIYFDPDKTFIEV